MLMCLTHLRMTSFICLDSREYRSHKRRFGTPDNIRMFGQSRGTSMPDFTSMNGIQDNPDIADLRLLSKRMAINISSLEKEIDRIVKKQGKMKLKKMRNARIRHRVRPSTVASGCDLPKVHKKYH